jgi:uncharacterized protein
MRMKTKIFYTSMFLVTNLLADRLADAQTQPAETNEISVIGEASTTIQPNALSLSVLIEDTGKSAQEAISIVEQKSERLKKALQGLNLGLAINNQGENISSAGNFPGNINLNAAIKFQKILSIETSQIKKSGEIIDSALANGASKIINVKFKVGNYEEQRAQTLKAANANALAQAQIVATSLGVKLGQVLSAGITEDPEAETLREQQQSQDTSIIGERRIRFFAALRFKID